MESIITLVVIIIAFNLINALIRAVRGDKTAPRSRASVRPAGKTIRESDFNWAEEPVYYRSAGPEKTVAIDRERDSYGSADDKDFPAAEKKGLADLAAMPGKADGLKSSAVASNLRLLLSQKDQLTAAFIFREIIEPPRGRRGRRF